MCYMEIYLVITFKGLFTVWPVHRQLETGLSVMEVLKERKSMQVVENRGVRARLYKLIWHSLLWFPFLEGEVKLVMFNYYLSGNWADCHVKYMDRRRANSLVYMKWSPVSNFFLHLGIKKVRFFSVWHMNNEVALNCAVDRVSIKFRQSQKISFPVLTQLFSHLWVPPRVFQVHPQVSSS